MGDFEKIEKVFHYTKYENALEILNSKCLKFGKLCVMNDINESYRPIFYTLNVADGYQRALDELSKYRQVSLTRDKKSRRGFDIPAMWAHYAEKGNGVCLVLDKKRLLPASCMWTSGNVKYISGYDGSILVTGDDVQDFFEKNERVLFFSKTSDWAYEQEFRILSKVSGGDENLALPIGGALVALILCFVHGREKADSVFGSECEICLREKLQAWDSPVSILELGHWGGKIILRDEAAHSMLK